MESIKKILNTGPQEPEEIQLIKKFVKDNYDENVGVAKNNNQIIVIVTSSSLAGTLRMKIEDLKIFCKTKNKIIIRIKS